MEARSSRNTRAFSLLELLLSVSILSAGIIVIAQAFSFSARLTGLASDMTTARLLAQDTMEEYEFFQNTGILKNQPEQAQEKQDKFSLNATLSPEQNSKLHNLLVEVFWQRYGREYRINFGTLLR